MSTQTKLITADEFFAMAGNFSNRTELVRGEIVERSPTGLEHGLICGELSGLLFQHVKKKNLGRIPTSDLGYVIARDPDIVRVPDVSFISQANLDFYGVSKKYHPVPPDLAVEVISPNDKASDLAEKVKEYLQARTPLVWIINPQDKTVHEYRPNQPVKVLEDEDMLEGYDVIPGFTCKVGELFPQ